MLKTIQLLHCKLAGFDGNVGHKRLNGDDNSVAEVGSQVVTGNRKKIVLHNDLKAFFRF